MNHHSEDEHYRSMVETYDTRITAILPDSRGFFEICMAYLPDTQGALLELGSGTGYATELIRRKNPELVITCLDHAPEMIAAAQIKPELQGVKMIQQDIREPWPGDQYDCIISTLCLHHIPQGDRQNLIRTVRASLTPGGVFICGDIIRPETHMQEEVYRKHWCDHMNQAGMSREAIQQIMASREHNLPDMETIRRFYDLLTGSGFELVLMPYRYEISAVFVAYRENPGSIR